MSGFYKCKLADSVQNYLTRIIFRSGLVLFYMVSVLCSTQRPVTQVEKPRPVIPVGVDRTVALSADSIASTFMVPESQRNEAEAIVTIVTTIVELSDSLEAYYELFQDSTIQPTFMDTVQARKLVDSALVALKSVPDQLKAVKKIRKQYGSAASETIEQSSLSLLELAHRRLERAEALNPLNFLALTKNIIVLNKISSRTADKNIYLTLRQKLNHLTQIEKSQPDIFYLLGNTNSQLGEWQKAFENYQQAQFIEERSAIFKVTDLDSILNKRHLIPFDTTRIVTYLRSQAWAKTKLYDDSTSLSLYRLALAYSRDPAERAGFKSAIDWILWDGGNIRASEINDSLKNIEEVNKAGAKNGYLSLLTFLKTEKAADEINWKIARIDFLYLNLKGEAAARLLPIIKKTKVDSSGIPIDSTYERYINDFGAICFNIGLEHLNQNDSKNAYAYFLQSAVINWPNRGSCYLNLAGLSEFNPGETIEKCHIALKYPLTHEDQQRAYQLLIQAYVKLGEFEKARLYFNISEKEKQMTL